MLTVQKINSLLRIYQVAGNGLNKMVVQLFATTLSSCWLQNKLAMARKGSFYARTSFYLGPVASDGFTKLLFKGQCHENSMSFCTAV